MKGLILWAQIAAEAGDDADSGGLLTDTLIAGVGAALAAAFVGVLSYLGNRRSNQELVTATQREIAASTQRHEKELAAAALEAERADARHKQQLAAAQSEADQTNDRELTRVRTERFGRAADQMASDEPLVRMAGVYAMAALADEHDDQAQRQKCIDVLCGYLRLPPQTDGVGAGPQPGEEHVRVAIVDTIREHCRKGAPISWSDLDFDFTGAQFHGHARFDSVQFQGRARFDNVQFHGKASFGGAQFRGEAWFGGAQFHGEAWFGGAQFRGHAWFGRVQFHGKASFRGAQFHGKASFGGAQFHGDAWFDGAQFHGDAWFDGPQFHGEASFGGVQFHGYVTFGGAQFHGGAWFGGAQFHGGAWFGGVQFHWKASFGRVQFHGKALFRGVQFYGKAWFGGVHFHNGLVLFEQVRTVEDINLARATFVEGCHPTFVRPDGSTTDALPLIEANWDGTDPDSGEQVDVTDRRDSLDSSRTNAAQTGDNKPEQAGED